MDEEKNNVKKVENVSKNENEINKEINNENTGKEINTNTDVDKNSNPTTNDNTENKDNKDKKCLIIGAGLGRTGTNSLKLALEILGYNPCYHMKELYRNPNPLDFWERVYSKGKYSWKELFDKYQATTDNPTCEFWEEILKEYPNSKIILTTRNPESWLKSCRETIFYPRHNPPFGIRFLKKLPFLWRMETFFDNMHKMFGTDFSDEALIKIFNNWNKQVEEKCPKEKLLKFEVKEGWKPLCDFLEKDIPNVNFPNVNDSNEFRSMLNALNVFGYVFFISFVGLLGGIGYYCKRRFFSNWSLPFGFVVKEKK